MGAKTTIEWTDDGASWNPIRARNRETGKVGWFCEHATPGCEHCYSEAMNRRFGTRVDFKRQNRDKVEIFLDEKILAEPLGWVRPRKIFVCSMTDWMADFVPDKWLDRIFAVMGACDDQGLGHTFQTLTKRAGRQRVYMKSLSAYLAWNKRRLAKEAWPPRNVWLGVSVEDQRRYDERAPALRDTPAALRWISYEPALGPVEMELNWAGHKVDWVIVGGEFRPRLEADGNCLGALDHRAVQGGWRSGVL